MRITRKILLKKLGFITDILGKTIGLEQGMWNLDYTQCYGGYAVIEYTNDKGGEHHPLLNHRLTAQHMADVLDACLRILEVNNANR